MLSRKIRFFPNNIQKPSFIINNVDILKGKVVLTVPKITKDLEGEYECKVTNFLSSSPFVMVEETAK